MKGVKTAEEYIAENPQWQPALDLLRNLFLETGMDESIKWGIPVYCVNGKNVAGLAAFKGYVGIWFYQGALIADTAGKLINAQEGVTRALRQWRFKSTEEVAEEKSIIKQYTFVAIENARKGRAVKAEKNKPLDLTDEMTDALDSDLKLKEAFEGLTLSRKREFAEHVATAKRAETRAARLAKIIPIIMRGEGLHDKYKK